MTPIRTTVAVVFVSTLLVLAGCTGPNAQDTPEQEQDTPGEPAGGVDPQPENQSTPGTPGDETPEAPEDTAENDTDGNETG